jgi:hypothetical protein
VLVADRKCPSSNIISILLVEISKKQSRKTKIPNCFLKATPTSNSRYKAPLKEHADFTAMP